MSGRWRPELASFGLLLLELPIPPCPKCECRQTQGRGQEGEEPAVHNRVTLERCRPVEKLLKVSLPSLFAVMSLPGSLARASC